MERQIWELRKVAQKGVTCLIREWVKVRLCVWLLSSVMFTPFGILLHLSYFSNH